MINCINRGDLVTEGQILREYEAANQSGFDFSQYFGEVPINFDVAAAKPISEEEMKKIQEFFNCQGPFYDFLLSFTACNNEYIKSNAIDKVYQLYSENGNGMGLYVIRLNGEWKVDTGLILMLLHYNGDIDLSQYYENFDFDNFDIESFEEGAF